MHWVLVHEMVHLALPEVGDDHLWLTEGLSTYVEGIARVQAGELRADRVWADLVRSMPTGCRESGDKVSITRIRGAARTGAGHCSVWSPMWRSGRRPTTASGCAMQWARCCAKAAAFRSNGPIERVLKTGDEATGSTVLSDLYAQMKDQPMSPDMDDLWKQLGIRVRGDGVEFVDDAPLAATRKAIMAP